MNKLGCPAGESGIHCNCPPVGAVCNRSHNIPRLECSTVLTSSRLTPPTLRTIRCAETRCELPHPINPTLQGPKISRHQFTITELYNVTDCINITRLNPNPKDRVHLGNSNCIGPMHKLSLNASKEPRSRSTNRSVPRMWQKNVQLYTERYGGYMLLSIRSPNAARSNPARNTGVGRTPCQTQT